MTKKILIVDDVMSMRHQVVRLLIDLGYVFEVEEAENGAAGLKMALKKDYDLFMIDWEMPVMNGLLLLRELKKNRRTKDTPTVMFTTKSQIADVEKALSEGVDGYLTKPFSPEKLEFKVGKFLKSA